MHKPAYVYLYCSSIMLSMMGYLLLALSLATKAQFAPKGVGVLELLDTSDGVAQAAIFLVVMGLYHFILGTRVDSSIQQSKSLDLLNEKLF
jgi:hypothetical protein